MIHVRIEDGRAISVEDVMLQHTKSLLRNLIASFWNRYFADRYEVIEESVNFVELEEDCEYQGWPCGNGKVCLISRISEEKENIVFANENLIA